MSVRLLLAAILAAATLIPAFGHAQAWPNRPVKLVVPYPPGGSNDAITRPFADALGKHFGQPFVIENRSGASGTVGTEAASRAAPDGYTVLAAPNAPLVLLPQLRKTAYTAADLVPVAPLGEFVYAFGVLPKLGVNSMAELVALAKAKPGTLSYSSPGAGSATNLRGEAFKLLAGVDILHVPYRTGAEALVDFLAGTVDVIIDNVMFPHAKAGKAKLLAVTASRRHPDFPDVPTLAEVGYAIDLPTWAGLYVPKGTPQEIQDVLGAAVAKIGQDPDIQARVLQVGFFPMTGTPKELRQSLDSEVKAYADWVQKTGIKLE